MQQRPASFCSRWRLVAAVVLLSACSAEEAQQFSAPAIPVTVATVQQRDVPRVLRSIGRLQSRHAPLVSAEVEGRILRLSVDEGDAVRSADVLAELDTSAAALERDAARAEMSRVQAVLRNEQQRVERFGRLHAKGSISRESLDDAQAHVAVLQAQLAAAQAQLRIVEDHIARAQIRAPLDGTIEQRLVSAGDFVHRGSPLFRIATSASLRALLPFPEQQAAALAPGMDVRLSSPLAPGEAVSGVVSELRPAVGENSRAVWLIVDVANPGAWRPDATVQAEVTASVSRAALVVPEASLVRRPAGEVLYLVREGKALQRIVEPGDRIDGLVVVNGDIAAGDTVALEGAAYLSDGAAVRVTGEGE
jgi:RND family efflux transporter MFP subunit